MTMPEYRIYTAGKMDWKNDEDSYWRSSLKTDPIAGVEFLHPDETHFDHGGDLVRGAVSEDISMIERADGVVAYFTENDQTGTLVELFHAISSNKPCLVIFHPSKVTHPARPTEIGDGPSPCGVAGMRAGSANYWFLLNYLNGDSPGERATSGYLSIGGLPGWVSSHDGVSRATTCVARGPGVNAAISEWVRADLGHVEFSVGESDFLEEAKEVADPDD